LAYVENAAKSGFELSGTNIPAQSIALVLLDELITSALLVKEDIINKNVNHHSGIVFDFIIVYSSHLE